MTKVKVKIEYDVIEREVVPDTDFEDEIKRKFESIGCKWYAQGLEIESGIRDIVFDLELP